MILAVGLSVNLIYAASFFAADRGIRCLCPFCPTRRIRQMRNRIRVVTHHRGVIRVQSIPAVVFDDEVPQCEHAQAHLHGVVGVAARDVDVRASA